MSARVVAAGVRESGWVRGSSGKVVGMTGFSPLVPIAEEKIA